MSNFEGIFKTKSGTYERVNHQFKRLNLPNRLYQTNSNGDYRYALNEKEKLAPVFFKTKKQLSEYKKNKFDNVNFYYFDEWIEYVNKNYWKKELPKPKIMYLDIEVIDLNIRKFPQPHKADTPITHIQIMIDDKIIILYTQEPTKKVKEKYQNVKFVKCKNEYDMFIKFSTILNKLNPSIVTAYNGNLFDFPYLMFRAMKLQFSFEKFSPLNEVTFSIELKNTEDGGYKKYYKLEDLKNFLQKENLEKWKIINFKFNVKGQYWLDYLELLKTFTYEDLPSYKLEYVAYKYLKEGEGKVDYSGYSSIYEFFEKDYDKFFEYAIQDPIVIKNLESKLQLINTLTLIAYLMGCNYDTAIATVQPWAIHLRHIGLKENMILPDDEFNKSLDKPIQGGYVKEPIKGRYEWLFSIDFNSLYPSIMDMLNLCGTTYIPYNELPDELKEIYNLFRDEDESKLLNNKELQNKIKELTHKYNVTFNGQGFFRRDKRGMIAQVVADIYYQRKTEKTKMLLANAILKNKKGKGLLVDEIIEKIENGEISWDNVYDIKIIDKENLDKLKDYSGVKKTLQFALKVAINSLYGAISNTSFIMFNRDIAAGITFVGRFLNRFAGEKVAKYLKEKYNIDIPLAYQDTDSCVYSTKIKVKNLYKVEYDDGSIEYLTKEELELTNN